MQPQVTFLAILLFFSGSLSAQQTGKVSYERLGISFVIPNEWLGQESGDAFIMGSNSKAGLILLSPHQMNLEQLRQEAQNGLNEGNGTFLQLAGNLKNYPKNAIGGLFEGTMEWQPAKAYIISMAKPHAHNPGLTIIAVTTTQLFDDSYRQLAEQVFNSLQISQVDRSSELKEWKDYLSNVRLTYMDSYYSSSGASGMASGGYSKEERIDLCAQGYFIFSSSSDVSVSGSGVSGYGSGGGAGNGQWKVDLNATGEICLILNYQNGEQSVYRLEYKNENIFLNSNKYFRTTSGEYAPNCH